MKCVQSVLVTNRALGNGTIVSSNVFVMNNEAATQADQFFTSPQRFM